MSMQQGLRQSRLMQSFGPGDFKRQKIPVVLQEVETPPVYSRGEIHAILFDSALPLLFEAPAPLRRMWTREAIHRASAIANLVLELEKNALYMGGRDNYISLEHAAAERIAVAFHSLAIAKSAQVLPVACTMRNLIASLADLCMQSIGGIELAMSLAPLRLRADRRRALVLASSTFVTNALRHGFKNRAGVQIGVELTYADPAKAKLGLSYSCACEEDTHDRSSAAIMAALSGILEAELVFCSPKDRMKKTEIIFAI